MAQINGFSVYSDVGGKEHISLAAANSTGHAIKLTGRITEMTYKCCQMTNNAK